MQDRFEEFLKNFGKAYENHIHTEADACNRENGKYEPTPEVSKQFYQRLSTVRRQNRWQSRHKMTYQLMKYVAGFLIIGILSFVVLCVGMDGFKEKVANRIIKESPMHTTYDGAIEQEGPVALTYHGYELESLPDGYSLIQESAEDTVWLLTYENANKGEIVIQISELDETLATSLAQEEWIVTPFEVEGFIADKRVKDGYTRITMYDDYHLISIEGQDQDEEVEAFARSLHLSNES